MRYWVLILLTVVALALGAGTGFLSVFFATVFSRIYLDLEVACVLLQKAENAGIITRDQRVNLVDVAIPSPTGPNRDRSSESSGSRRAMGDSVFDLSVGWREQMKSGCPDA